MADKNESMRQARRKRHAKKAKARQATSAAKNTAESINNRRLAKIQRMNAKKSAEV